MVKNEDVICPECSRIFKSSGKCFEAGCPGARGCKKVKCPDCGSEFYPPAPLTKKILGILRIK